MKEFNEKVQAKFDEMSQTGNLFRVKMIGQEVWDLYLASFQDGNDPQFRDPASSTHNCNHCKNFIRRYGNIVAIDENFNTMTMFDVVGKGEYIGVAEALSNALKSSSIVDVFYETFNELNSLPYEVCKKTNPVFQLGIESNYKRYTKAEAKMYGVVKEGETKTFNHIHLDLLTDYVDTSGNSVESIMANHRDNKNVFQRGMEEIPLDTLMLVKDLIVQGSLLNGETHLHKIETIIPFKVAYDALLEHGVSPDNWCWVTSKNLLFAKFKNELIGVLCTELAQGEELNKACLSWNKRVDPTNYMKATAPITQRQIRDAQSFVEENEYVDSFCRRVAVIEDINVSEIKHANIGNGKIASVSIFDGVQATKSRHKRNEFEGIEEVTIEKFMKDILPSCTSVEAYLENKYQNNMVTLTTSASEMPKPIFNWDNGYSWTYNGNLAGKSMIEEAINKRGGKTDGVLNVRLHFPESTTDYDLCITEPNYNRIVFTSRRKVHNSSGMLDLDAQGVDGRFSPDKRVENINYTDLSKMPKGTYSIEIDNYGGGTNNGFTLEVKTLEGVTQYEYKDPVTAHKDKMLKIDFNGTDFTTTIVNNRLVLTDTQTSAVKEIYGLKTNEFHKVNLMCLSPNHWGSNNSGNKHYFFMLDGCKTPGSIRSFHVENLNSDLLAHRKVMEVLGNTTMVKRDGPHLSGLGFNATVRDELIVKLSGNFKRTLKIKF